MTQLIGTAPNQVPTNGDLGSAAFLDSSAFYSTGMNPSFRNRWINGKMEIAQRTTSAVTAVNGAVYPVDRWNAYSQSTGQFTAQQSTDVPTGQGFQKSVVCTVSVATNANTNSSATSFVGQYIEGYNVADLMWGTANAKPITVSFWVKSSIPGNYALTCTTGTGTNRSFVRHYTIINANTWEYKTVTIPGSTLGGDTDWAKDNGRGMGIWWGLGSYATWQGTLDTWGVYSNGIFGSPTSTQWINTAGATFYITGIQVEAGTVATPFEHRSFATELLLCQRYFEKTFPYDVIPQNGATSTDIYSPKEAAFLFCGHRGSQPSSTYAPSGFRFKATKRTTPAITVYGNSGGYPAYKPISGPSNLYWIVSGNTWNISGGTDTVYVSNEFVSDGIVYMYAHFTASAEL